MRPCRNKSRLIFSNEGTFLPKCCADYRGIPTNEQEEMVMDICRKLGLDTSTDLATRAATSVRYWVAHKSWRLRDHFKVLGNGPLWSFSNFTGSRYKSQHRNEDWSNALPPISAVKPMTNQKEVELWLFQSLGMRLATRRIMSNPQIRKALWIVFIGSLRYESLASKLTLGTEFELHMMVESLLLSSKLHLNRLTCSLKISIILSMRRPALEVK